MVPNLIEALRAVPDPRTPKTRNVLYPLASLLGMVVCAMFCGCTSQSAIAQWGRNLSGEVLHLLGLDRHRSPCMSELSYVLRRIDRHAFEQVLLTWLEAVFAEKKQGMGPQDEGSLQGVAFDGKALRGASSHSDLPGLSMVSRKFVQERTLKKRYRR